MAEREKYVVVDQASCAMMIELRVDLSDRPEQLNRLIDEVRSKVIEQTPGIGGCWTIAPSLGVRVRPPALHAGFESGNSPEFTAFENRSNGEKVTIPTTIVEDTERHLGLRGLFDESTALFFSDRKRLVDDDRNT
jgi:hypothetical protein